MITALASQDSSSRKVAALEIPSWNHGPLITNTVEKEYRKIDNEEVLTRRGKRAMKWALGEIGGMPKEYRGLPGGVTYPQKRDKNLCDLLENALDEAEKRKKERKEAGRDGNMDE